MPYSPAQAHSRAASPEQVSDIDADGAEDGRRTAPENDHQCGYGTALTMLARMIADLQAHIDRAAAQTAAPRIGAALNRVADAEHQLALARQQHDDLKRDTDRTIAALRRRTKTAELMVVRCHTALHGRDDTGVPPEHRAAWNAGWQACAASVVAALTISTSEEARRV